MNYWIKFGAIAVVFSAAIGAVGISAQTPPTNKGASHMEHNEMYQACAKACSDCQRMCDMCATHCSHMLHEGKKEHITTLGTCQDCATFCSAAAQILARGGPFSNLICASCADACAACAKECDKFPNDKHMKECGDECRKCEKACREMAKHKMNH